MTILCYQLTELIRKDQRQIFIIMLSEKELIDRYQLHLHIDDKTKQEASQLFSQYMSKQGSELVVNLNYSV